MQNLSKSSALGPIKFQMTLNFGARQSLSIEWILETGFDSNKLNSPWHLKTETLWNSSYDICNQIFYVTIFKEQSIWSFANINSGRGCACVL